jgi:hypothetical protein
MVGNSIPDELLEIDVLLKKEPSELRASIVDFIGSFTVALLTVSRSRGIDRLLPAGTGTLVSTSHGHFILTAAHVWETARKSDAIGITLKPAMNHRYLIPTREIVAFGPARPASWNEWGPDLALLRIPAERVGSISAYRLFYNLARPASPPKVHHVELRVLMGVPETLGVFKDDFAQLIIHGLFCDVEAEPKIRASFDYIDLSVNVSGPDTHSDFRGVSGGGLWKVRVYQNRSIGKTDFFGILEGVAFHQSDLVDGRRILRCHGPESIRIAMSEVEAEGQDR